MPKARFGWKALWAWVDPGADAARIAETVDLAQRAGFNVLIVNIAGNGAANYAATRLPTPAGRTFDPLAALVRRAHSQGIEVYAWIGYLRTPVGEAWWAAHPDPFQVVTPPEQAKARSGARSSPDRVEVHAGDWLCPDRGLAGVEREITEEIVGNYDVDGVAIDFLGYRNYTACYCEYSNAARRAFAAKHPDLSPEQVLHRFSRESLVRFSREVSDTVAAIRPDVKIACHVYPEFDPDPLYANGLHVDYCGQTIAWFYTPHWSYTTIRDRHKAFMDVEGRRLKRNRHVPFIGCRGGALLKSAERLRTEIRLAGSEGCDRIMFAFSFTLEEHPELVDVLREELD